MYSLLTLHNQSKETVETVTEKNRYQNKNEMFWMAFTYVHFKGYTSYV